MHIIKRHALVPYTAEQMFDLVNDIEHYADFLPWCYSTSVHYRRDNEVEASIEVAQMGIHKTFTTRNQLVPGERIDLRLVDGPFETLEGHWQFQTLGEEGCRVSFLLEYEYKGAWTHLAFGPVFSHIANHLVDAFCQRARAIYAP